MSLTDQQIRENEKYFSNVLNTLGEGGCFGWIGLQETLTKRNGKLSCSQKAYDKAKEIVSNDFLLKYFEVK